MVRYDRGADAYAGGAGGDGAGRGAEHRLCAGEGETYELSVTADELVITPTAFAPGYAVTVNGQAAESGTAVTMPVNAEGAEIAVAVSSGGRSRTYTLAVQRVAAVDVTVRHDSDVTVHVFNSARAEIGAAEQGSGFGRFALVPGEAYTYVTDKQTWYHAAGGFTAAGGTDCGRADAGYD